MESPRDSVICRHSWKEITNLLDDDEQLEVIFLGDCYGQLCGRCLDHQRGITDDVDCSCELVCCRLPQSLRHKPLSLAEAQRYLDGYSYVITKYIEDHGVKMRHVSCTEYNFYAYTNKRIIFLVAHDQTVRLSWLPRQPANLEKVKSIGVY